MKKALAFLLVCVCLSFYGMGFAETKLTQYDFYAIKLSKIGVFKGTGSGFELDRKPTRLEGLIMLIRLLGKEDDALASDDPDSVFSDVPAWAVKYTNYAKLAGLSNGIGNDQFGSTQLMNANTYHTFLLRALGYDDSKGDFTWNNANTFANQIGVISDDYYRDIQRVPFLRDHVAKCSYDTLHHYIKGEDQRLVDRLQTTGDINAAALLDMNNYTYDQYSKTVSYANRVLLNTIVQKPGLKPLYQSGTIYLPAKELADLIGAGYGWQSTTKTIKLTQNNKVVSLKVGETLVDASGTESFMDVPPKLISGVPYLPVRYTCELFESSMSYTPGTNTLSITSYPKSPYVEVTTIGSENNATDAWWGEEITKIARSQDTTFSFTMVENKVVHLNEKKQDHQWEVGASFTSLRAPVLLVDSDQYVHAIIYEPFDQNLEGSGRLTHIKFNQPNTIKGSYSKTYLTTADSRKDTLTLENYSSYYFGGAIGIDDTMLIAYNNSTQYKIPGGYSLGVRIYDPEKEEWQYETVADKLQSRYCYPYAFVSDDFYHVVAIEDDPDDELLTLDFPYKDFPFRYGAIKHYQRPKSGGAWVESTLVDLNAYPGVNVKTIEDANLRVTDLIVDGSGTVHVIFNSDANLESPQLACSGSQNAYHYYKKETETTWNKKALSFGTGETWIKLWERNGQKLFYIYFDRFGLYAVPFGGTDRYLIYKNTGNLSKYNYQPFVENSRSSRFGESDLFVALFSGNSVAPGEYIHARMNDHDLKTYPIVKYQALKGRLTLPTGEVAPKGGLLVPVCLQTNQLGMATIISNLTIPEGQNGTDYTLMVNESFRYILWYDLFYSNPQNYVRWGVYTPQKLIQYIATGTLIDVKLKNQGYDLKLYYGK